MGIISKLTSLAIIAGSLVTNVEGVCRALAMSGGGNSGSYEAGVIWGLNHYQDPANVAWDVVSGVSAGAINALGIALWDPSEGVQMSEWLVDLWTSLKTETIWVPWKEGYIRGIFEEYGALDDGPLLTLLTNIHNERDQTLRRKFIVSAVDVNSGNYISFDGETLPKEHVPLATISSASLPFIFPHRQIGDYVLMDGGTVWNTNIATAIEKCEEIEPNDSKIIIDIVLCGDHEMHSEMDTGNSINNF